jgi:hypothetical protein
VDEPLAEVVEITSALDTEPLDLVRVAALAPPGKDINSAAMATNAASDCLACVNHFLTTSRLVALLKKSDDFFLSSVVDTGDVAAVRMLLRWL